MYEVKRKLRLSPKVAAAVVILAAGLILWLLSGRSKLNAEEAGQRPPEGESTQNSLSYEETEQEAQGAETAPEPVPVTPARPIDPDKPMVALTFDDGPNGESSRQILDCLETNGVVATFFEIGCNVKEYPDVAKRAYDLGCEIGSHTFSHKALTNMSAEEREQDRQLCKETFESAIGVEPKLIRPPQGSVVHSIMDASDQIFVGWSVDTEDWLYQNVDRTVNKVKQYGDLDGQVILMHSIYKESAEAAEQIIPWLVEQGYQLVTVSELFQYHYGITPEQHFYYAYDYFISDGAVKVS